MALPLYALVFVQKAAVKTGLNAIKTNKRKCNRTGQNDWLPDC